MNRLFPKSGRPCNSRRSFEHAGRARLWILFLILILGVPTEAPAQSIRLAPYVAFAWDAPWLGRTPHVSPMIWLSDGKNPGVTARKLTALPAGRRVLFVWHAQDQIWGDPDDAVAPAPQDMADRTVPAKTRFQSPWLDHGAAARSAWFDSWLEGLKRSGASVDFLVTDAEVGLSMWGIQQPQIRAIAADPRFSPLAERFGIHDIANVGNIGHWDVCAAWNEATGSVIASYFRAAYYTPLARHFPDAGYCEYNDTILPAALAERARDLNGWASPATEPLNGTHQSPPMYGQVRQLANGGRNDGTNPDFKTDLLATVIWEAGCMRALKLGSNHPILPWFGTRSCRGDDSGGIPIASTPYWNELFYHAMLCGGCIDCLFFDPKPSASDVTAMNDVLATLQSETGNSTALTPLTTDAVPFNAESILSGARCDDGRRVFRVSVMPGIRSATVTLPGNTAAQTVLIPEGQVGQWIVVSK